MQPRRNNQKGLKSQSKVPKNVQRDQNLILRPAFKGQPVFQSVISSDFQKLTTTVTSGSIARTVNIDSASITNFAARFPGFEEYRIVKAVMRVTCFSSTNPGRIVLWIDDDDATTPTLQMARNRRYKTFAASDVGKTHLMTYTPHDLQNLNYISVGVGGTIGYFKFYTDNAALGSSIVATDYLDYSMDLTVQFRGFQG
jgi:hypothetical protein